MKRRVVQSHPDYQDVVESAEALLSVTTDVAGEKVAEAREQLATVIEKGRETLDDMQQSARKKVDALNESIHEHPYEALGIAFGVGTLLGVLLTRGK